MLRPGKHRPRVLLLRIRHRSAACGLAGQPSSPAPDCRDFPVGATAASATFAAMNERTRTWIAAGLATLALAMSLLVLLFGRYEPGLRLAVSRTTGSYVSRCDCHSARPIVMACGPACAS